MERVELEQWKGREVARLLALVESERRYYQEIVASIPVGLLVLSADLSVISSNRAVRKIFGLRSGDPVRGRLDTLLPTWVLDAIKVVFDGQTVQNLSVDHEGKALRVSALPIRNGDEDNQFEALVSIEDVTGIKAAQAVVAPAAEAAPVAAPTPAPSPAPEAAAEPASKEAVELLQSLDAIIWAADIPGMNFLFVTNTAEEVLGYHPDHWLNTPGFWAERIDAADRDAIVASYKEAIEHGRRHSCEYRARTADGRLVWLRDTVRVLSDAEGNPKHVIGLTIDITERRQLEAEHVRGERMDAIHKLSSRLSHDLNNVLMIVKGYSEELLGHVAKNDPLRSDIQEILTATDRIGDLTNHLLAFTRRQATPAETLDLSEMLGSLAGTLRQATGALITIDIQPDPGLQAKAGRAQLQELLTGLASRAKVMMRESGKLTITIREKQVQEDLRRTENILAPGRYAVIEVEDSDGLLDHDAQMALFESFLPARDMPGETGAIISRGYTFVRQWGGDISVESTPAGTRIAILLPYAGRKDVTEAAPARAPAPAPVEEPAPVEPPAPAETILVVEDEAGIRALVRKILRRQGFTVLEAANGEEAMKVCKEQAAKIDLLITDVVMPKMGGRQLAESLREHCTGDIKVLYVSGYTDDAALYAGDFPPGTAFLQKPFTLGSLLDKVKEVLGATKS